MDQNELKQLLHYDPETGKWTWLIRKSSRAKAGTEAGTIDDEGYRYIVIDGKRYRAARLAWFYMTGEWPEQWIDHEDQNPLNDKWDNLRQATPPQNAHNRIIPHNNTSGVKGVHFNKQERKWVGKIMKEGKQYHHYFKNFDEAVAWRKMKEKELHGEFAWKH